MKDLQLQCTRLLIEFGVWGRSQLSIIREYLLNRRLLVTIIVTNNGLSKSLTAHYSAMTTHIGPRDLFEYISKFEAKASNTAANNDDSISKLMKPILSK